MSIKNSMEIKFLSLSSNESFARVVLGSFATQLNPTLEEIADIKTAVSEAVTNSIIHAYQNEIGDVLIKAELRENEIMIEVSDTGRGIENVDKALQPFYTTGTKEERSGMGFTVMQTFMDKLIVSSELGNGTKVIMIKKISSRMNFGEDKDGK